VLAVLAVLLRATPAKAHSSNSLVKVRVNEPSDKCFDIMVLSQFETVPASDLVSVGASAGIV
jgi:hypothetical protein